MTAAGVVLLIVGVLVGLSEAHNPTHGIAGGAGVALMALGLALTVAGLGAGVAIGVGTGVALAAAGGGAIALTVSRTESVRHLRVRGGAEGLLGELGVVRSWDAQEGRVTLHGGVWNARRSASSEDGPALELHAGDRVVVERLTGLTLSVRPAEDWELI